ncbi:MAG: GFA family protein [Alphaproteobacteria bacterium]
MAGDAFHGGCLCGAVRFQARPPSRFVVHCHRAYCRTAHGAAFVTWVGFPDGQFALTAGSATVRWYRSSAQSQRGFCTQCGTTLFFRSEAAPGETHVVLAAFDGPVDSQPTAHIFFDQHVPWLEVADTLPKVDGSSPGLMGYAAVPRLDRTGGGS